MITESFAKEIGADGYSKDAADAVKLVERLVGEILYYFDFPISLS